LRGAFELAAVEVRSATMAGPNHIHVGCARDGDAVGAFTDQLLWHEAAVGYCGGGILSGSGLLHLGVVSSERTRARDRLLLCLAAPGQRRDGKRCRNAAAAGWAVWSARLAVAVPGGGAAGGAAESGVLVHACGETEDGKMAA